MLKQLIQVLLITCVMIAPTIWAADNPVSVKTTSTSNHKPIKIGVLSFRPKPQTLAQWKPLETVLKKEIPEYDFVVEALSYPELDNAVREGEIDFVLTNPAHYIMLKKLNVLSSPLATLSVKESGKTTSVFGGVIFTRADENSINTLKDISHKKVAITDAGSMGGYHMELYELSQENIRLPKEKDLVMTGMPHDNVVDAVLSHRADIGFVRSGILEGMIREGKLDSKKIKIINRQISSELPVMLSTRLYPEWPIAALPDVDQELAKKVVATLFSLEDNSETSNKMGISGFIIPADYALVDEMLRELRLPLYTILGQIMFQDIWERYRSQIIFIFFVGSIILLSPIQVISATPMLFNSLPKSYHRKLHKVS